MVFPGDFIWGAAASAYQIEGAACEDGRGPSIWDMFCRRPGAVRQGESGDRGLRSLPPLRGRRCPHAGARSQGLPLFHRLPRVLPQGRGTVNQAGLDFYDRLIDALLRAGITPFATLHHWDYPFEAV